MPPENQPTKDYILEIIKPLDIIRQYYDKILAVNLNPETNGGFTFSDFQWKKNGIDVSGETGEYLYLSSRPLPTDEYMVTLTTTDGQVLPTCAKVLGQSPLKSSESLLKAFPNPAQTEITIENADWEQDANIVLYDKSGVKLQTYPVTGFQTIINVSTYPAGNYIIQSGKLSTTIIIKK
jgi:hypothetical protein